MRICLTLALCFTLHIVFGQNTTIKGSLVDATDKKSLHQSVISVINNKDSILASYTRAATNGSFKLNVPDTGAYMLMVTHPFYGDFVEHFTLKGQPEYDFGTINLIPKAKLLEEVIVKSGAAIRIKGDTTIYTADSFKVREGANVEELLKKLPGIQVDRDGKITAMGETVKNVLVDGEEFFGNDPGIATKNLEAKNIKEVQVFDKKSDQAAFTGVDDGVREKTINLKLKDNAKKGYFGKIEAGGGTKDRFSNQAMINNFRNKRKLSAYGIMSNTGKMNLDWQDDQKYGSSSNVELMDGGGIMITSGGDDYNYSGGIPTNWNAGFNYSNKWNADKHSLNASYKGIKINAPDWSTSNTRTFLLDSVWNTNTQLNSFGRTIKHNVNATTELKLDSNNTLKIIAKLYTNHNESNSNYYSEALQPTGKFINKNFQDIERKGSRQNLNTNVLWMHRFKKEKRTISINTDLNFTNSNNENLLQSLLVFYRNGDSVGNRRLNQKTIQDNGAQRYSTRVVYTEPLNKELLLELSMGGIYNHNKNYRDVLAYDGTAYADTVAALSNDFDFKYYGARPGTQLKWTKKKYNLTIGGAVGFYNYNQLNLSNRTERSYNFTNYFPTMRFEYKFSPSKRFEFNYNGNTNAPSIDALQPIANNEDPLNIQVGNPDLKPSMRHGFNLNFNSYNMLKERYVGGYSYGGFTQNGFVSVSTYKDSIRYTQTVNANGVADVGGGMWGGFKWKKPDIRINFNPDFNYSKGVEFITSAQNNTVNKNITQNIALNFNIYVGKFKDSVYSVGFSPRISYNNYRASINSQANTRFVTYGINFDAWYQLPLKFEIATDANFNFQKDDPRFTGSYNFIVWNASLTKRFKNKDFETRLSVYDILNQNQRYNRNINGSSVYESNALILKRFAMLSLIWNFKNKAPKPVE